MALGACAGREPTPVARDATAEPRLDASVAPPPDASVAPPPDASDAPPPDASVAPPPDASVAPPPDAGDDPTRVVIRRRLTRDELAATLRALLRVQSDFPQLPLDARIRGYDTDREVLPVSSAHTAALASIADDAASRLDVASAPAALAGVPCDLVREAARCLETFITRFGRRAYRRPLTGEERASFAALAAATGGDHGAALRVVVAAMIQSPMVIYAVESVRPDPVRAGSWRLDGWSTATRLALLLWGEGPDDALLDRVARGDLDTPDGVRRAVDDMLGDARARAGTGRFVREWLRLYAVDWLQRDPARYPRWPGTRPGDLREETTRFADEVVWGERGDLRDLLTGAWTWMNPGVARLYGVAAPSGDWARVGFAPADARAGILTQPSVLAITALAGRESTTLRGEYVRSVLLCEDVGSPPPEASDVPPGPTGETERQRTERHARDPACSGCHARLDPVGSGFERYDGVGVLRAERADLTGRGAVAGLTPSDFTGPVELGRLLRQSGRFDRCAATQLLRFALGRAEVPADGATLDAMTRALASSGYRFPAMAAALASSDAFLSASDAEVLR